MSIIEVSVGGVQFRAHERSEARYGTFWRTFSSGSFEPATVAVLCAHLTPGATFFDGGAWIGPFTLLGAALGASVVAVEPDPMAVAELRANLALNPELAARVEVRAVALAERSGTLRLQGGDLGLGNGLTRMTPLVAGPAAEGSGDTVPAVDVASLGLAGFTVIKFDIEGGEFAAVARLNPSASRERPRFLLSLHGPDPQGHSGLGTLRQRLAFAPRQLRLQWAIRRYHTVRRIDSNRTTTLLGRTQRLVLAFRLGETELILSD